MIVYVESNFVLELALLQEEYQSCEKLLSLGEADSIRLVLPALCLTEPLDTLVRRAKDRKALASQLEVELKQLSRTALYKIRLDRLQEIVDLLLQSAENETLRLFQKLERILKVSEIIPMGPEILTMAADAQRTLKLSPQDSIVYASVVHHLNTANASKKCFINRNSRDFHQLDIKTTLESHNCKLLFSFEKGYNYIKSQMS
jgi:predicted nucleic acid-binding protein